LSEMYEGRGEPHDAPDERGIRTVCEELNMSPISDSLVIYHKKFSEKERRSLEQGLKHFATIKIDAFLAFKTEQTVARWLLTLRHRFQVRTRNIRLVIGLIFTVLFQTILEKCMCEPGNALSTSEESILKTVLQMLSTEDTALRLPQPSSGIGRRPTNVSSDSMVVAPDSMVVAPDLKQEELCLIKRYETYSSPPRGHRVSSKGKKSISPASGKTEADSKTSTRLFRNEKEKEVPEAIPQLHPLFFFSQLELEYSGPPDDYILCLKHEAGDFDSLPEDLQKEIQEFTENNFIPALLKYLGTKYEMFRRYSVYQVERYGITLPPIVVDDGFTKEQEYDLFQLQGLLRLPVDEYSKLEGKRAVGSAIRICKAIDRQDYADRFIEIVGKHFTPDEHQDRKDRSRRLFDLPVEPSIGGIQCKCCLGEK